MKYKIIFDGCHDYRAGDVVEFPAQIDTAYLLKVGAIEVAPEPKVEQKKPETK
jgi:hypothetical protein